MQLFTASIDFNDIVSIQKLRGLNQSGEHVSNLEIKKNYLYDYYIQINVAKVNGQGLDTIDLPED